MVGNGHMALMTDARADELATEEGLDLHEGLAGNRLVAHLQMEHVGLAVHVGIEFLEIFLFLLQLDAADVADSDDGGDDAHHAERIGAGITQGNGIARVVELIERFVGGTQTGGIGHGTIEHTYHHGQRHLPVGEVDGERHGDVEHHDGYGQHVERHATLLKGGEERRTYLQTDAEDKQNQAELADEVEDVRLACEAEVAHQDACKEHERHTQ